MSAPALPVFATLAAALLAPLKAGAAFWKTAAPHWLGAAATGAVLAAFGRGWPNGAVIAAMLLVVALLTRVMVLYHRALLLPPEVVADGPPWGRREAVYLATGGALVLLLAGLVWVATLMLGPFLALAIAAIASGMPAFALTAPIAVVLAAWVVLLVLAPLLLLLPAGAVERRGTLGDGIDISRGQRARLAVVTGALPAIAAFLPATTVAETPSLPVAVLAAAIGTYALLAAAAAVTFAWAALAGGSDPSLRPAVTRPSPRTSVVVLILYCAAVAGVRLMASEVPYLRGAPDEHVDPAGAPHDGRRIEGEMRLLTRAKAPVRVRHVLVWDVADAERYEMALGSRDRWVTARLGDIARDGLRSLAGRHDVPALQALVGSPVPSDARERLALRAAELGLGVREWRIVAVTPGAPD